MDQSLCDHAPVDLINQVTVILNEVVSEELIPRFRALQPEDVSVKATPGDAGDLVTIVDHTVEKRLTVALTDLWPGAVVIGEEAAHESPQLLGRLSFSTAIWLIDPVDGTKNFVRGDDTFAVLIALVKDGQTRAGWLAFPARGQTIVTEDGGGTFLNEKRIRTSKASPQKQLRGTVYTRFMPPTIALSKEQATCNKYEARPPSGSAAIEYSAIIQGLMEFVIYFRLLPWDHAAGALALTEAGGCVEHRDGRRYSPLATDQVTILSANTPVGAMVRNWLR
jgi:fructose-1,6-bisphosphatase/inositol monophosphatase family enzyme